ncbi:MAG: HEAT repeat domain-containing protein [Polyangiaceae bacterium]
MPALRAIAALAALLVLLGGAPRSQAQDARTETAFRDLATGGDFRLRVAAALSLGKSKLSAARVPLEKALGDPHPAVRAAAAAALAALGDSAALPALRSAASRESGSVKSQMETSIKRLTAGSSQTGRTRFLVALGRVDARTQGASPGIMSTLRAASRNKIAQVPGVELLADGTDGGAESKSRGLPVLFVDCALTQLARGDTKSDVSYAARVEYLIRKVPEQTLKGTMTGRAEALADVRAVRGRGELAQLQVDAVTAAVDSAMKGATVSFEAAAGK